MPSYSASLFIQASPERVYDAVADIERHGEWSADPLTIARTGPDTFRSSVVKGKPITADLKVVERKPPGRFSFDATDLTGSWNHTFTLTPVGTGTRVTREISGALSGAQLLLFWIVLLPIKKPNARRALERLRDKLEGAKT
jgi:uncharacterized protein YndB with AHSA1/START domain